MSSERDSAHVGLKIGQTLELARKERGLSLGEVEEETKIRARYLKELERENFEVLPPVYVQGSLKTYANFLGLDGEALTRELRRRQPPEVDPEAPTKVEPPRSDYLDRYLISRGAAGVGDDEIAEDDENAGAAPVLAGDNRRLYLVSGAFVALILVSVALVLTLAKGTQPEVSQVREPLVSKAPSQVSHASDEGSGPAPQQEDSGSASPRPDQPAGQQDKSAGDDAAGKPAQEPADATAIASVPPAAGTATAGPAATPAPANDEPASANDEPAPAATRPTPAASETPAPNDQGAVEGPVAAQNDDGPVKNFSITRDASAGGISSPSGTRTSCSREGGPKVLQDKEGFRACLKARVGGHG